MTDWQALLALAPQLTVTAVLVIIVVAFQREHIVSGAAYRRLLRENAQLLNISFRLAGIAKSATDIITVAPPGDGER